MSSKVLQVTVREVYGVPTVYPANEAARLVAELAGTKTLTHRALCTAERLGFTVEQVPAPLPAGRAA